MVALNQATRDELVEVLGSDGLVLEGEDLQYYGADRCRGGWPVDPIAIAFPRTIEQVQGVVRVCAAHSIPVVPSGGRTGLTGAATATNGELVLSLEKMAGVLEVDTTGRWLRCEAGATVEKVREAAAKVGLSYPIDFAAKGSAQIGGSIATNAGGINVLRYGMTREWVMGLSVVLASGELLETGGPLVKDNTGYDLRQMFIGSEGTLGVIVGATLRLCSPPAGRIVCLCSVPSDAAVLEVFARLRGSNLLCSGFECFDAGCLERVLEHRGGEGAGPFPAASPQHVLIEVELEHASDATREAAMDLLMEMLADAQEAGEVSDAVVASTPAQEQALWAWREDISESLHRYTPHKADVALPVSRVAQFVERWRAAVHDELGGIPAVVFGHVGDGNLHLNHLRPEEMALEEFLERCHRFDGPLYALVEEFGGSVSAEHGIGLLKREHLHHSRSGTELEIMRALKQSLDPKGLLNPGKLFVSRPS